jgi:MscS family membrane protein
VDVVAQYFIVLAAREESDLDETIVRFTRQIAIFLIIVFCVVLILQQWGQDVGALVAGLGIASLAVALAAQDALANIIAYFAIVTDAPFKVGDMVIVDDVVRGRVQEISFRSTRIRTVDNSLMVIPNQTIANANVINWARTRKRRLDILLGVTYSTTAEQIQQVIADTRAMLQDNDLVTTDRIVTDFVEYGDSSLNLRITFMAHSKSWEDLEAVKTDVNLKLMAILKQRGVEVAFPTRTLHLESHVAHKADEARIEVDKP